MAVFVLNFSGVVYKEQKFTHGQKIVSAIFPELDLSASQIFSAEL
ncbi:MAG: hypothetical protein AAF635_15065 [Cyanobacteria bacterium P01_C01_bin.69]